MKLLSSPLSWLILRKFMFSGAFISLSHFFLSQHPLLWYTEIPFSWIITSSPDTTGKCDSPPPFASCLLSEIFSAPIFSQYATFLLFSLMAFFSVCFSPWLEILFSPFYKVALFYNIKPCPTICSSALFSMWLCVSMNATLYDMSLAFFVLARNWICHLKISIFAIARSLKTSLSFPSPSPFVELRLCAIKRKFFLKSCPSLSFLGLTPSFSCKI